MCKLLLIWFLISIVSLSILSLSTDDDKKKEDARELQLNITDPDVLNFVENGWYKLVVEGRTKGAGKMGTVGPVNIKCARVQVKGDEKRFTILAQYADERFDSALNCFIFVWTRKEESLSISCYKEISGEFHLEEEEEQYDVFKFFYDNKEYCPELI